MVDHGEPIPVTVTRPRGTPDDGQSSADQPGSQRRQLRVVLPDVPALPPASAAVLLRIVRTADQRFQETSDPQQQATTEEERRAA